MDGNIFKMAAKKHSELQALQIPVLIAISAPRDSAIPRRGGRVVYGTRFEIGRGVILTVGSNPTLSAIWLLNRSNSLQASYLQAHRTNRDRFF